MERYTRSPVDFIFIKAAESLKYKVLYESFQRDSYELTEDIDDIGTENYYDLSDHLGVYSEIVILAKDE